VTELATLEARNRQRWVDIHMDAQDIRTKLDSNDMPNARLVLERSAEPDWIVRN
jgi:pantothenate kinase